MNNFLNESLNVYSNSELRYLLAIIILVAASSAYFAYYYLKDKRYIWLHVVGVLSSVLLFLISSVIASNILETITNGYQQVGLYISMLIAELNLFYYTFEAIKESQKKRPDPDHVNRRHFKSTLNNALMLLILGLSFGFFTPVHLGQVIFVISISSALTISLIHAIAIYMFKDVKDAKSTPKKK